MKAYRRLVAEALKRGYSISVFDDEATYMCKNSTNSVRILEEIESVDEAILQILNDKTSLGVVRVSCDISLEDDETIIDWKGEEIEGLLS